MLENEKRMLADMLKGSGLNYKSGKTPQTNKKYENSFSSDEDDYDGDEALKMAMKLSK